MNFIEKTKAKAAEKICRIVLPEGTEERTIKAADIILNEGFAKIVLIGNPNEIKALAEKFELKNIETAEIIDP